MGSEKKTLFISFLSLPRTACLHPNLSPCLSGKRPSLLPLSQSPPSSRYKGSARFSTGSESFSLPAPQIAARRTSKKCSKNEYCLNLVFFFLPSSQSFSLPFWKAPFSAHPVSITAFFTLQGYRALLHGQRIFLSACTADCARRTSKKCSKNVYCLIFSQDTGERGLYLGLRKKVLDKVYETPVRGAV